MANVRCPMCSKLNPPEALTCAYCGARLKQTGPATPSGNDEPDWLRSLRSDEESEPAASQPGAPGEGDFGSDVPDWLSRIRDRARTETGDENIEEPDWMKGLEGEAAAGKDELGDWMDRLQGDAPAEPPAAAASDSGDWLKGLSEGAPAGEEDDWMSKLSAWQTTAGEESQPESSAPASDLSWLSESAPEEQPAQPSETGFGLAGFLSNIDPDAGPVEEPHRPTQEPGIPEWQPGGETEKPEESLAGLGLTGFLADLEEISGEEPARPAAPAEESAAGDFDWAMPDAAGKDTGSLGLTGFLSSLESTGEPSGAEEPPQEEAQLPEWTQEAGTPPFEGLPEWLSSEPGLSEGAQPAGDAGLEGWLGERAAEEPAAEGSVPPFSFEEGLPAWLAAEETAESPALSSIQPEEASTSDAVPDWLSGFGESTPAVSPFTEETAPEGTPPAGFESAGLPSWLAESEEEAPAAAPEEAPAAPFEGLPDWFASFDQADLEQTQPQRVTGQLPAEEPESAEEVPDWLSEFNAQPQELSAEGVAPLIGEEESLAAPALEGEQPFTVDLPEWLSEDETAGAVEASEAVAELGGEELAQAELPEWVKEMRPIESMIPEEAEMTEMDQRVEKAGPLSGMRGVLPAEELATRWTKPPIYSVKLHVTEKQRSQASLLESILAQETQPLLIPPERSRAPGMLLRAVIALILIVALVIPFVPDLNVEPLGVPALYPAEMLQMFEHIDKNLQSNAPVLLAVDYQPGLSGEMQMTASSVVDHLMSKNARIVVISTVPTGPALAQQLVADAGTAFEQRTQQKYDLAQNMVNLGYLPGGTISLLEFAQQPALAAPTDLAGQSPWGSTFLKDVSGIAGFSQIVVITDSGETGRAWVEQVQPWIGDVPLFMVTSAQAAPLMAPYVESNQVAGMVSGLLGGAMYAQLTGQSDSPALGYLAAYQIGMVLAFVLVLVGGLVTGISSLFKRSAKQEE